MNLDQNNDFLSKIACDTGTSLINKGDHIYGNYLDYLALIVTSAPDRFASVVFKTVLVRTCKEALKALKQAKFNAVFCDLEPLGPGENGLRFAHTLHRTGSFQPLFLMADEITLADESTAMHQGAMGLILKKADAVVTVLESVIRNVQKTPIPASDKNSFITPEDLDQVKVSLRCYIGPIADDVVLKTWASISIGQSDGAPLSTLIHEVSSHIQMAKERDRFLTDLGM